MRQAQGKAMEEVANNESAISTTNCQRWWIISERYRSQEDQLLTVFLHGFVFRYPLLFPFSLSQRFPTLFFPAYPDICDNRRSIPISLTYIDPSVISRLHAGSPHHSFSCSVTYVPLRPSRSRD